MGFFSKLKEGLTKTRDNIVSGIDSVFSGFSSIDDDFYDELEETLIMGDIGVVATEEILDDLKAKVKENKIKNPADCKQLLIDSIKEKMDLDIQVSRLRLLKANYTSQKYRMEDNIVQHYPRQIVMVKELIEKLEQDIALYEQNAATSKDKFHMQVGSGVYDTRKDAGNAIIKFFQTDADGTAKIGTYLGFSMNIAFDSFNRKFVLRLKGAMNHPVEIGPDPVGNIIRLNNVLKTMPDKLAEAKDRLETLTNQLESAKIEVTKPFQQEEELAEKLKRLAELNALLNMDEKGTDALILEDDEQPAIVNSDMAVTPITSVKTKPMLKKKVVGLCL